MAFDIVLVITIIIALSGLVLAIINAIINYIQQKRMKISILKLPAKMNLFKEWYDIAKDITNRMEFTEKIEKEYSTIILFKIRSKDNSDFITPKRQRILMERYRRSSIDASVICGFKSEGKKVNLFEMNGVKKILREDRISIPNDMLPKDNETIKNDLLEEILRLAKENGIKKKHLRKAKKLT